MQSVRLIVKNAVLWVMFLASMAASVFFSFNSHFNAIFPAEQRKRAAEIRTTNQIGGVVADIGALTQKRQIEEAERLFDTDGWKAYDKQLSKPRPGRAGRAGRDREIFRAARWRSAAAPSPSSRSASPRRRAGQAGLARQEDLAGRGAVAPRSPSVRAWRRRYDEHKAELDAKAKEIDAKRVEAWPRTAAWKAR